MSHPPTFAVAISAVLALAIVAEACHFAQHPRPMLTIAASPSHPSHRIASFE